MSLKKKKIILGVVGEIGAGKGELARYLSREYKAYAYRSSEVLRDILKRMYLEENRVNVQDASTMIRKFFGEDIISRISRVDLKKIKNKLIVIDGLRREADFKYFKNGFDFKVIYVEADIKKRFRRISKRKENVDDEKKTFQEFQREQLREAERKIQKLKSKADFIIENNGSLKEFYREIDNLINKIIN